METLELKCEVITPMFLSGANEAELRAPSIKGILRYWWRSLNGHLSLKDLKKKEGDIFGSIESGDEKKSRVNILLNNKKMKISPSSPKLSSSHTFKVHGYSLDIFDYLLYGVLDSENHNNSYTKNYFNVSSTFDLVLNCQNSDVKDEVLKSLYVWNEYGGLGAKSRNGFGSIYISNLNEYTKDFSMSNLFSNQKLTPYTSFVEGQVKWFELDKTFEKWKDALGTIGMAYRNARLRIESPHHYEERQYIGAPLEPRGQHFKSKMLRHSKPYFLKVKKVEDEFKAGILFIPSLYIDHNFSGRKGLLKQNVEFPKFITATNKMNEELKKINNITMIAI